MNSVFFYKAGRAKIKILIVDKLQLRDTIIMYLYNFASNKSRLPHNPSLTGQ